MLDISRVIEFEWDEGNWDKNEKKHGVVRRECEEIFGNVPLIVANDIRHSDNEVRYLAMGKTNKKRFLSVIFTMRRKRLRVISARDMNVKERKRYEK